MEYTQFAGLTALEPGESIQEDNASFIRENPRKTDRLLQIGAVTHRHDAHAALAPPIDAPSATALPSGGQIPADLPLYVGYTLRDADNGETVLSEISTVTTELPLDVPDQSPNASADYTAGSLVANTYYYAISVVDAGGGETPIGPDVSITRDPGYASGQVLLSGLLDPVNLVGGISWRLWRAVGGGDFFLIATGATDTFTDDGLQCTDCAATPVPDNLNFTNGTNRLEVIVPSADVGAASAFSLYVSVASDFADDCLVGTYPTASAGQTIEVTNLLFEEARPPDVPTAIPGANKIDPDTELIDWHWKRPVASSTDLPADAEEGDVRVALDTGDPWRFVSGAWGQWAMGGGGGGLTFDGIAGVTDLTVFQGPGLNVDVSDLGAGAASMTLGYAMDPWAGVTYASSAWVDYADPVQQRWEGRDIFRLRGRAKKTSAMVAGDVIADLPKTPGDGDEHFAVVTGADGVADTPGRVRVSSVGEVIFESGYTGAATNPWVSLSGIAFSTVAAP